MHAHASTLQKARGAAERASGRTRERQGEGFKRAWAYVWRKRARGLMLAMEEKGGGDSGSGWLDCLVGR